MSPRARRHAAVDAVQERIDEHVALRNAELAQEALDAAAGFPDEDAPNDGLVLGRVLAEDEDPRRAVHADRGSSMTSKPVAFLLADLGVTKTHSRPHVSDDNPYSESQFRTLKYRPDFPDRFGSLQDSRSFCQIFFPWYNEEHRHSGIALLTPAMLHYGQAPAILAQRQGVLLAAYHAHPERFVRRAPQPLTVPTEVWINKPENTRQ